MSIPTANTEATLAALVEKLLNLAQQILSTQADYILVIEEYAQTLSEMESQLVASIAGPVADTAINARLKLLESQHAQVMAKVDADKELIMGKLKSLKKKGKAVITYTDQLPKRISLGTKRKV